MNLYTYHIDRAWVPNLMVSSHTGSFRIVLWFMFDNFTYLCREFFSSVIVHGLQFKGSKFSKYKAYLGYIYFSIHEILWKVTPTKLRLHSPSLVTFYYIQKTMKPLTISLLAQESQILNTYFPATCT